MLTKSREPKKPVGVDSGKTPDGAHLTEAEQLLIEENEAQGAGASLSSSPLAGKEGVRRISSAVNKLNKILSPDDKEASDPDLFSLDDLEADDAQQPANFFIKAKEAHEEYARSLLLANELAKQVEVMINRLNGVAISSPDDFKDAIQEIEQAAELVENYVLAKKRLIDLRHKDLRWQELGEKKLLKFEGAETVDELLKVNLHRYSEMSALRKQWMGMGRLINRAQIDEIEKKITQVRRDVNIMHDAVGYQRDFYDSGVLTYDLPSAISAVLRQVQNIYVEKLNATKKNVDKYDPQQSWRFNEREESPAGEVDEEKFSVLRTKIINVVLAQANEYRANRFFISEELLAEIHDILEESRSLSFSSNDYENYEERERIFKRTQALPYEVRTVTQDMLGSRFDDKIKSVLTLGNTLQAVGEHDQALATARDIYSAFVKGGTEAYDLHRALGSDSRKEGFNPLKELDFRFWRAISRTEEFRTIVEQGYVENIEAQMLKFYKDKVLTTPEHTSDSSAYSHILYQYDGPEAAEYNIINAWREVGMSGQMPFLYLGSEGTGTKLYEYIQKQTPETLVVVSERNPAIGKILKIIADNPDSFTRAYFYREDPESNSERAVVNPVYTELHEQLIMSAAILLDRESDEDQFFSLGLIKRYDGAVPQQILDRLSEVFTTTDNQSLKIEIVNALVEHIRRGVDEGVLNFFLLHLDELGDEPKERLTVWKDNIIGRAMNAEASPAMRSGIGKLFGLTARQISDMSEVYYDFFATEDDVRWKSGPSMQAGYVEILQYLGDSREELAASYTRLESWLPDVRSNISYSLTWWHTDRGFDKRMRPSFEALIMRKRNDENVTKSIVAYAQEYNSLPPGMQKAFSDYFGTEDEPLSPLNIDEHVAVEILKLQGETNISQGLKRFFMQDYGMGKVLRMSADSARAFIKFVREIDKAYDWSDVYGFINAGERASVIDVSNSEDLEWLGKFIREFGTEVPVMWLRYYLLLGRDNIIPDELRDLGVKNVGAEGVNEMRRISRNVRSELLEEDKLKHGSNEVVQAIVSANVRFESSQWRRAGKSVGDILMQVAADMESGAIQPVPQEYVSGSLMVDKLDVDKIKDFEFSEGFNLRYKQYASAFESVHTGGSIAEFAPKKKESILLKLRQELNETSQLIRDSEDKGKNDKRLMGLKRRVQQLKTFKLQIEQSAGHLDFIKVLLSNKSKDAEITQAIQELLLVLAHDVNPNYSGQLVNLESQAPNRNGAMQMMAYVEDLVLAETVPQMELDKKQRKRVQQLFNFNAFQDELMRQEKHALKGKREVACIPSRGVLAEFSGYYGDACWTSQDNIVRENPDMVGIAFIQNLGDPINERIIGSTLLFERTVNGEPVLVIRGMNPMQNVITGLSADSFLEQFMEYIKPIVEARGIKKIVAPIGVPGTLTNRPGIDAAFRSAYGQNELVRLDEPLTFNDYKVEQVIELINLRT